MNDARELFGREEQRSVLREALARVTSGRGAVVVISGEPGIGKTALATAIGDEAAAAGAVVVWGRAWEFADAPPYFPLWPCLRALGIDPLAHPARDAVESAGPFALWERVLDALAHAASAGPMILIVEDAHAADVQSLDLLAFLAPSLRALAVMLIVTRRDVDVDPRVGEAPRARLARIARAGTHLRLGPLDRRAVARLAAEGAGAPLAPDEAERLAERTGGNPLFVLECAHALRASGGDARILPHTVREIVIERVTQLAEPTQRALAAGAILGREFHAAIVAKMLDVLAARAIDMLAPALRAGLLHESRPGAFVFAHALVRDGVEDALAAAERVALHGRAAVALDAMGEAPEVLVERARHALAGLDAADDGRVLALASRAVALLEEAGAVDRAYALHLRIDEARRAGLFPVLAPGVEGLRLAAAAFAAGRTAESRRACEEVRVFARRTGDAPLLARATLLAGAELRPGTVDVQLVAALEESRIALDGRDDSDPALACRVLARLAAALQPAPDPAVPMAMATDAIARARALGDDAVACEVLEIAGSALVDYAPVHERIAMAHELLARATAAADRPRILRAQARLAIDAVEIGDLDAFALEVERMTELSTQLGHARYRWRPLLFASMRALMSGDFAASERLIAEAGQLAAVTDDGALPLALAAHQLQRTRLQQRDDEVRAAADAIGGALRDVPSSDLVLAVLRASLFARIGDCEATAAELARVEPRASEIEHDLFFSGLCAEAVALAGNDAQRRRLLARMTPFVDRELPSGHIPITYEGPVARIVALLEASLGDHAAAEARLRAARDRAEQRGFRPWVAQIAFELSSLCAAPDAARFAAEAAMIAEALGMTSLAHRARARTAPGVAPSASRVIASHGPLPLRLEREGDTWRLDAGARSLRVRGGRGVQLLARLLERPGEEVHVLALASDEPGQSLHDSEDAAALDATARAAYRERLREIAGDLEEAERHADRARLERLTRERDALEAEIARAVGLGGHARRAGAATERARVNVQRRIKDAVARIGALDADLGLYLEKAVRTGTYCSYRP